MWGNGKDERYDNVSERLLARGMNGGVASMRSYTWDGCIKSIIIPVPLGNNMLSRDGKYASES
jgi:hypothetical protein